MTLETEIRLGPAAPAGLRLALLGMPLDVEVGRAADIAAVAAACSGWEGSADDQSPLKLRIERSERLAGTDECEVRLEGTEVVVDSPGARGRADLVAGTAHCLVSDHYLASPRRLREQVLEPLLHALLNWRGRPPLHAAGFVVDGLAILLAGRSGAGKSCLARAADKAGFEVFSEDIVSVQLQPSLRVWGWASAAHLLPSDHDGEGSTTRVRNGTLKHAVALRSASTGPRPYDRLVLCVLGRGEAVSLTPLAPAQAVARLLPHEPGFDLLAEPIEAAMRALAANGAWELRLSHDPAAAVALLAASVDRLWPSSPA